MAYFSSTELSRAKLYGLLAAPFHIVKNETDLKATALEILAIGDSHPTLCSALINSSKLRNSHILRRWTFWRPAAEIGGLEGNRSWKMRHVYIGFHSESDAKQFWIWRDALAPDVSSALGSDERSVLVNKFDPTFSFAEITSTSMCGDVVRFVIVPSAGDLAAVGPFFRQLIAQCGAYNYTF